MHIASPETYPLVVDDLDNSGELASEWASGEKNDTANLDQSPLGCLDLSVTHCARCIIESGNGALVMGVHYKSQSVLMRNVERGDNITYKKVSVVVVADCLSLDLESALEEMRHWSNEARSHVSPTPASQESA